ncbi:MAG: hypothetical protein HQL51_14390 [Magnetococcales bacterium]|nr:hypothetical protein [Magnetococcales bacterium]
MRFRGALWMMAGMLWLAMAGGAAAFSKPTENSEIDPALFRIDESKFMGVKFGHEVGLLDEQGAPLNFADLPPLPFVLVPGYYTCDGSCSSVAQALKELLKGVTALQPGVDFTVVSVSFDKNDTLQTLNKFRDALELPREQRAGWRFTLFQDPEAIAGEMGKMGYKYFWSPRDKTFFHPTLLMTLTPEGRVARYLNIFTVGSKDLELALLEAKSSQFRPSQTLDYLMSLCYSYNFKEGRYTLSIPVFVGLGSFLLGIGVLVGSLGIYRLYHRRTLERKETMS